MRHSDKTTCIQRRTFVKTRLYTITLNSIHTVHDQSINMLVKCLHMRIHGHFLSYKQSTYTKVCNEKNRKDRITALK